MEMHSSSRMTGVIWAGRALRPQLFRRTSKSVSSLLEIIFRSGVASFPLPSDHFQIAPYPRRGSSRLFQRILRVVSLRRQIPGKLHSEQGHFFCISNRHF